MSNLKFIFSLFLVVMVVFSSCVEDSLEDSSSAIENSAEGLEHWKTIDDYPAEITMDNWEQFIRAPQEVIDYHSQRERELRQSVDQGTNLISGNAESRSVSGYVRKYKFGAWNGFGGVTVSQGACSTTSSSSSGNNYFLSGSCSGLLCMSHPASDAAGVSATDLVIVNRHVQGWTLFTQARQFIAADVSGNGTITLTDVLMMQDVILGNSSGWPGQQNFRYIPTGIYNNAQGQISNGSIPQIVLKKSVNMFPCLSSTSFPNRYAIKVGDVNFSY